MERTLDNIWPILDVEHDCILSKQGDITIGFEIILPEIFTLSNEDYEAFHQSWVKAIRILPRHSIFHKQDWFIDSKYDADFSKAGSSFLTRSSEQFLCGATQQETFGRSRQWLDEPIAVHPKAVGTRRGMLRRLAWLCTEDATSERCERVTA